MVPLDVTLCHVQTLTQEPVACTSYFMMSSIMERQDARLATHPPLQAHLAILCQYKGLLQAVWGSSLTPITKDWIHKDYWIQANKEKATEWIFITNEKGKSLVALILI